MDLSPVFGKWKAVVSGSRPHLPAGARDTGSRASKEAERKRGHKNRSTGLATRCLIVDFNEREPSRSRDDCFKVGNHEGQRDCKREGLSSSDIGRTEAEEKVLTRYEAQDDWVHLLW